MHFIIEFSSGIVQLSSGEIISVQVDDCAGNEVSHEGMTCFDDDANEMQKLKKICLEM